MHLSLKSDSLTFNQSPLGHPSAQHEALKSTPEASRLRKENIWNSEKMESQIENKHVLERICG